LFKRLLAARGHATWHLHQSADLLALTVDQNRLDGAAANIEIRKKEAVLLLLSIT